jgi:NAD(P)-dependent dehydrogenase (short-subunit alcohol dehydrogenase family)
MPQDLAGLAVFLASDAASYCTGGVFVADGGLTV